jgi:hypothetical protein
MSALSELYGALARGEKDSVVQALISKVNAELENETERESTP